MARAAKRKAADDGNTASPPKRKPCASRAAAPGNAKKPKSSAAKSVKQKMPPSGGKTATGRRSTAAKRTNKWNEPYVITNEKSPICDIDLIKLLSDPRAWNCLEEDEKEEILSLLPDGVHPNPDGDPENPDAKIEPPPFDFLRYSVPWRDAVRQFQIDIENGRYDPEWQRQAHQAVQERADGTFDKWKEEQFEEFWGQKQKLNKSVIAGASSKIRLEALIKNNLVQVGDVWKHHRSFLSPRISVEKEVKIIASDGKSLTFAIPAGRRVFLSGVTDNSEDSSSESEIETHSSQSSQRSVDGIIAPSDTGSRSSSRSLINTKLKGDNPADPSQDSESKGPVIKSEGSNTNGQAAVGSKKPQDKRTVSLSNRGPNGDVDNARTKRLKTHDFNEYIKGLDCDSDLSDVPSEFDYGNIDLTWESSKSSSPVNLESGGDTAEKKSVDTQKDASSSGTEETSKDVENASANAKKCKNDDTNAGTREETVSPSSAATPSRETKPNDSATRLPKDIILRNVRGPGSLQAKILNIDGRIEEPPNGNAWKDFRCYRNNQDIGSLWDIRQAWYIRNYC